ncbi:hypothetical protein CRJUMX01_1370004 [Escherichia coli]|nr:hypothetical protein CRJUMX01_1370004 [Escherichia coli]
MTARSWNVFAIAGEAVRGGGGGFQDETGPAGHRPPPQIFVHGNFFENNWAKKEHGKTTKSPRLPG